MIKRIILLCAIFLQLGISVPSYSQQNVADQEKRDVEKESYDFIANEFCYKKADQLAKETPDYPWREPLREILCLIVKLVLFSPQNPYGIELEKVDPASFSDEHKNFLGISAAMEKIINRKLTKEQAFQETEDDIKAWKYPGVDWQKIMRDVRIYLSNLDTEEILAKLNKKNLQNEFKEFYDSVPDYRKPLKMKDFKHVPKSGLKNVLYGVDSANANYSTGIYINQNGEAFPIKKVEKAKTAWEILEVPAGDIAALAEKSCQAIESITPRFDKTIVESFDGSCQDAVIEYGRDQKVALVSFANGEIVGGGSLLGKIGQEELNIHCIAGLYDSLLPEGVEYSDQIARYADVFHSPESVLYSKNVTLIKRIENGVFSTANNPILLDVISVAGINFNPDLGGFKKNPFLKALNLEDPYGELDRRIELMFVLAIINEADTLILGKYNLGNLMGDSNKISEIYNKYIKKYDKYLAKIILAAGDFVPYSD